jgi:mannosylglycerate hydrolase
MSSAGPFDVHVVSHTHWDREWYLPFARFRQRLVALIDELLDAPPARSAFLLDGQAVLLEDYLAVRPDREKELRALLTRGALEAGPWFVLADEMLTSGEALVRNLLAGARTVRARGGTPLPVLYCPDSFGHPADLPTLAVGFGFSLIILWRGLGGLAWPKGDAFRWSAPGRARVLVHHLPPAGYEYGSNLSAEEGHARERWRALREVLAERARTNVLLVLNGADHHARQSGLDGAIDVLTRIAEPDRVRASGLAEFARAFVDSAGAVSDLPEIEGELRFSPGYAWTVPGTWSSRAYQKRRNARVERLLTREAEPWAAITAARGGRARAALVRAAWRTLLECHPHDTLCGCSTDDVARAADARFAFAETEARGIAADAILDLVRHDPVVARVAPAAWRPQLLVRNPAARPRGGVAEVEIMRFLAHEPVGPGSAGVATEERALPPPTLDGGRAPLQVLKRTVRSDRVESPRHYPDNDRVEVARCVTWAEQVPGYGIIALPVGDATSPVETRSAPLPVSPVRATAQALDNGIVRVTLDGGGAIRMELVEHGGAWTRLIRFEDVGDAGDLYTHSPIGQPIEEVRLVKAGLVHSGPLRGELRARFALGLPVSSTRGGRAQELVRHDVDVRLIVDAGSPIVRIDVRGMNRARDHRLRVIFATGVRDGVTLADAMFGPVTREQRMQPNGTETLERVAPTAPLARWISRVSATQGLTVISDGLGEYEAMPDGGIAVTLVRSVGALSRNDLPERPGHAGWPTPTPGAQVLGPYHARFAVVPHGSPGDDVITAIERAADDVLLPLVGTTLRSAMNVIPPVAGLSLEGEGLRFLACKESEEGEWTVLRCVNATSRRVTGSWRCGWPVRDAREARLDEQPGDPLPVREGVIEVTLAPSEVATVLVR